MSGTYQLQDQIISTRDKFAWTDKVRKLADRLGVKPIPEGGDGQFHVSIGEPHGPRYDIMDLATAFLDRMEQVQRAAILAEREACAKICEETWVTPGDLQSESCTDAAEKIRARPTP